MRKLASIIILVGLIILTGCANLISRKPERLSVPPYDGCTLYARGLSIDIMTGEEAEYAAALNARNALATSLETYLRSITKRAVERVGMADDREAYQVFSQVLKQTVDRALPHMVIYQKAPTQWDPKRKAFRAEVIYKVDTISTLEIWLDEIKKYPHLYERLTIARPEGFPELEEEIERLRKEC